MTEQVRPIRRYIDQDLVISDRNRFEERRSGRSVGVELQNPGMVHAEAELFGGAEHAVGLDAADFAALELEATGERRADRGERVGLPRLHVGSAADDLEDMAAARIDLTEREPIGIGVLLHLEHACDEDLAQILMDRHDAVHWRDLAGELIGDLLARQGATEQRFEPAARDDHLMNCSRNRTSLSKNSRISGIP